MTTTSPDAPAPTIDRSAAGDAPAPLPRHPRHALLASASKNLSESARRIAHLQERLQQLLQQPTPASLS